jgi:adenylate cyclase, class 2
MAQSHETEIKLAVADPRALKRKLKTLGFRPIEARRFESNRLFDFSDLRLRRARCLLRLRFESKTCRVTFKGAPIPARGYKVRSEIETYVEDGECLRQTFENLGLREVFRYDKYRTTYGRRRDARRRHPPLVEFDETPIGTYVELEGPPRWIDSVARGLGYSRKDYVAASYAALYFEHCKAQGRSPKDMVFGKRK